MFGCPTPWRAPPGERFDPCGHNGRRRGLYALSRFLPPEWSCASGHRLHWRFTALLAALIAVQQDDIKRILAYPRSLNWVTWS